MESEERREKRNSQWAWRVSPLVKHVIRARQVAESAPKGCQLVIDCLLLVEQRDWLKGAVIRQWTPMDEPHTHIHI